MTISKDPGRALVNGGRESKAPQTVNIFKKYRQRELWRLPVEQAELDTLPRSFCVSGPVPARNLRH